MCDAVKECMKVVGLLVREGNIGGMRMGKQRMCIVMVALSLGISYIEKGEYLKFERLVKELDVYKESDHKLYDNLVKCIEEKDDDIMNVLGRLGIMNLSLPKKPEGNFQMDSSFSISLIMDSAKTFTFMKDTTVSDEDIRFSEPSAALSYIIDKHSKVL